MTQDPFPKERLGATMRRLPAYLQLAWRLLREPLLSRAGKVAVGGAAAYLVSPVDLVPGIIPVLGQLDDLAVALAALRFALASLDPRKRREHLDAVGLTDQDLNEDLRTLGVTTAWIARAAARTGAKAAKTGGRLAWAGAKAAGRASARVATAAAGATARAARSAADATRTAADNARAAQAERAERGAERAAEKAERAAARTAEQAAQRAAEAAAKVKEQAPEGHEPKPRLRVPDLHVPRPSLRAPRRHPADELLPVEPDEAP